MGTDFEKLQEGAFWQDPPWQWQDVQVSSSNLTLLGQLGSGRTPNNTQRLFHILSGEDLDHPLCEDCTDSLLEQLDTESESETYRRCLGTRRGEGDVAGGAEGLKDLEERQFHRDYSKLPWQQLELHEERMSVENRLGCGTPRPVSLAGEHQRLRVRSTFAIRHDSPLPVMGNFRLGCIPTVCVLDEISAAWGQTALLLLVLTQLVWSVRGITRSLWKPFPSKVINRGPH